MEELAEDPFDNAAAERRSGADGFSSRIGQTLREQRERMGISLRELARRIEVSPSLISQIERDRVRPSVQTLYALVTALGLTMDDVFPDVANATPTPTTLSLPRPLETPESRSVITLASGVRWERLTPSSEPFVEFLYVVYPVGASSCPPDSLTTHGGKEYGYVVSGRLGVRIGFDEYKLGPGTAISFDSSAPHRLWTIGEEPATGIWVVVGRQGDLRIVTNTLP